jgi:GT2 family glycosyltransferase
VHVEGKFLCVDRETFLVRGVTYGTFRPDPNGDEFPDSQLVEQDFASMAAINANAVRTYTVPPRWLLDVAWSHGLRVMVGVPTERYLGYLMDGSDTSPIEGMVRDGVGQCAGHPALLCVSIGNEFPAASVRWLGRRKTEAFVYRLYRAAKAADPGTLVTYVNYPSTEYLQLPFLDLACFNVYLESPDTFEAYLDRLQSLAGERPLLMGEIGLDSRRHGEAAQARTLRSQIRASFAGAAAGAFAYAWTDEWYSGGAAVEGWDFGLTRRDRSAKPALAAVREGFSEVPFPRNGAWPRISVVVCSYNGSRTIGECLTALKRLNYPNFEVIVVDDGSTDRTAAMVEESALRVITTEHRGLSHARNVGWREATGEIVAYVDDDAYPHTYWLTYLAAAFAESSHAGIGGPNLAPPDDGFVPQSVANSPGNPTHVLITDREAEHIPGCNMAFRRTWLEKIGGFDEQFTSSGDDVDICWRISELGGTLGFSPGAFVWHHRRGSVGAYWRQQMGYGHAEQLLKEKWPSRYNVAGHVAWIGRVYGKDSPSARPTGHVYHGVWGLAPFQSLYERSPRPLSVLPLTPQWSRGTLFLGALSGLGTLWHPLLLALPFFGGAMGASLLQAVRAAARARLPEPPNRRHRIGMRVLIALLHVLQPLARLFGGLRPARRQVMSWTSGDRAPRRISFWSEQWQPTDGWLQGIEDALGRLGLVAVRGGPIHRWDLEVRGGAIGGARLLMAVEEHGGGRQLIRLRARRWWALWSAVVALLTALLAMGAAFDRAYVPALVLVGFSVLVSIQAIRESAAASAAMAQAVRERFHEVATPVSLPGRRHRR